MAQSFYGAALLDLDASSLLQSTDAAPPPRSYYALHDVSAAHAPASRPRAASCSGSRARRDGGREVADEDARVDVSARLCGRCWRHVPRRNAEVEETDLRVAGANPSGSASWMCKPCTDRRMLQQQRTRQCRTCYLRFADPWAAWADSATAEAWQCSQCAAGANAPASALSQPLRRYPCQLPATIQRIGETGLDVWVSEEGAPGGGRRHAMRWADLQPADEPVVAASAASVRWRFHGVRSKSLPSEWCGSHDNHWMVGCDVVVGQEALQWRTGHMEVRADLRDSGSYVVHLAAPYAGGVQLLFLGRGMHLCLQHRTSPLEAFCDGPRAEAAVGGTGPWPCGISVWPDLNAYGAAWRRLLFMEAATCAVAEGDSVVLGDVQVRWTTSEAPGCGSAAVAGVFNLPAELLDAHRISFRAEDLLCVRWRQAPRTWCANGTSDGVDDGPMEAVAPRGRAALVERLFVLLGRGGRLGSSELRPFAEFTGFEGGDAAWPGEFAALCEEIGLLTVSGRDDGFDAAAFTQLVSDDSERGCFCSDEELEEMIDLFSSGEACVELPPASAALEERDEAAPTWVVHATVESSERFGDDFQVRFRVHDSGMHTGPPVEADLVTSCVVEVVSLPESYRHATAAIDDLANASPLLRGLVLRSCVPSDSVAAQKLGSRQAGQQDLSHLKLNESQQEAVRLALTEPVALVHGPPGTGKTRTAAAMALAYARENAARSDRACVLYAAAGNRAVDVAVEAIAELCVERLEDLFQSKASEDEVCAVCWSEGCNVITFCGHVFHRSCLTQALRSAPRGSGRHCPICRAALKSIDGIRLLRIYSGDTEVLEFPIPRKYEYGRVRERRRRAVPEEMRRFALHWRIHGQVPGHQNPFAAACGAAYDALRAEGAWGEGFVDAKKRYSEACEKARAFELRSCDVLLTTNCSCRRNWVAEILRKESVELLQVILDEAGTTVEPETLCPLTLASGAEHVVLVGDYRQLRPVVKNRDAALLGFSRSLFERLALSQEQWEATAAADGGASAAPKAPKVGVVEPVLSLEGARGTRTDLVAAAFAGLNATGTGRLRSEALRKLADLQGFEGDDAEWRQEYEQVCSEQHCDPTEGLDFETFQRIVEDDSEDGCGCFCTDAELRELAGSLVPLSGPAGLDGVAVIERPPSSVLLRQQYRMHPSMNRFPSRQFYGGQVGDDISTLQRPAGLLAHPATRGRCAVLFWASPDTFRDEKQEVATRDASAQSKANPPEAWRAASLAAELAGRAGPRSVVVLSWYNAQVAELRRRLQELGQPSVHCGSVVTAQGSEWDYVILSTVRSSPAGAATGPLGCLADRHLLNVAVTRGRLGIVVLGSPELLKANRHWASFIDHCTAEGGLIGADERPLLAS